MASADGKHAGEIASGARFEFGRNWAKFLERLNAGTIERAQQSLAGMLGITSLQGLKFLDAGSGSGLFSLAARRLGAQVVSIDYDPASVWCTQQLRTRYQPDDPEWQVHELSILGPELEPRFGLFDVVYSWGVVHHTGQMWKAVENLARLPKPGGSLFLAIYNDQGFASRCWWRVKQLYNAVPTILRPVVLAPALMRLWGPTTVKDLLRGRPFQTWRTYPEFSRGMDPWRDVVDWVGGYPFEVATPRAVTEFLGRLNYGLDKLNDCGSGSGCNEFVFRRLPPAGECR